MLIVSLGEEGVAERALRVRTAWPRMDLTKLLLVFQGVEMIRGKEEILAIMRLKSIFGNLVA